MAEQRGTDRDRGSVLMLVPAGVLVLVMLAGMTFDFAHLYLAQCELAALAESVANDAATYAIDRAALRLDGHIVLDQRRADVIAALASANPPRDLHLMALDVRVDAAAGDVVVTAEAGVDPVFLRAIPGAGVPRTVHADARAALSS